MIMINGSLKESQWADKNTGQKRTKLSVKMYNFAFVEPYDPNRVDSGGGGSGGAYAGGGGADPYSAQATNAYVAQPPAYVAQPPAAPVASYNAAPVSGGGGGGGHGGGGGKDELWRDVVNNPDGWCSPSTLNPRP